MRIDINDLRKVKGIGSKTLDRIKEQFDESGIINEYDENLKLKHNSINNGDTFKLMNGIGDNSIDLSLIDPPYKLIQGGCTNKAVTFTGSSHENLKDGKFFNDNDVEFDDWLPLLYRVMKNNTHSYIMSNDRNLKDLIVAGENAGFELLNILTWKKSKHSPNRYYMKNTEFIVMFRKGNAKNINDMGSTQFLKFDNVDNKIHPTEKPIDLLEHLILNSTQEGEIVLDCFSGSGSLAVACINTGRKYICIEKDREYYDKSVERVNNLK